MQKNEIYENYIELAFNQHGLEKQATFKFKQFEHNYKKFFPVNFDSKVLDIGIGRGEMLSCMKDWEYHNCYGIDISPSTIKHCQELNIPCELVESTEDWLNSNFNNYSVITLLDVLEHIKKENIISFLKSVNIALTQDGIVIIQVPNLQAPDGQLHRYNDFTHEVGFIENSLRQVLMAAGFNDIEMHGFEEMVFGGKLEKKNKKYRKYFWEWVKFTRRITGNINPAILNPVMYAIAKKNK